VSRLTYAASAWWGFATVNDHARLQGVLKKATRWQLYNTTAPSIIDIVDSTDSI